MVVRSFEYLLSSINICRLSSFKLHLKLLLPIVLICTTNLLAVTEIPSIIDTNSNVSNSRFIIKPSLLKKKTCDKSIAPLKPSQNVVVVSTKDEFIEAYQTAKAGQTILVKEGIYHDWGPVDLRRGSNLAIYGGTHGTPENPIRIIAENSKVVFTGNVGFWFGGTYIYLSGFKFLKTSGLDLESYPGMNMTIYWAVTYGKIIANTFEDAGSRATSFSPAVYVNAPHVDVIGNHFRNTHGRDISGDNGAVKLRITYNKIEDKRDAIQHGQNGTEEISLGVFGTVDNMQAIIAYNCIQTASEVESISLKSNDNIVAYNYIKVLENTGINKGKHNGLGGLSVSQGHRNKFIGNYLDGVGHAFFAYGEGNTFAFNYVNANGTAMFFSDGQQVISPSFYSFTSENNLIVNNIVEGEFNTLILTGARTATNALYSSEIPNGNQILNNYIGCYENIYKRYTGGENAPNLLWDDFTIYNTIIPYMEPTVFLESVMNYRAPFWWDLKNVSPETQITLENGEPLCNNSL